MQKPQPRPLGWGKKTKPPHPRSTRDLNESSVWTGILTYGSTYSPKPSQASKTAQWHQFRVSSPITVACPRWNLTTLPY